MPAGAARRSRWSLLPLCALLAGCGLIGAVSQDAVDPPPAARATTTTLPDRSLASLPPQARSARITLVAGGDLLIHSAVWESARQHAEGDGFDFRPMFEPVAGFISAADLALCHLEVPLSADNSHLASYPVFSAPYELADAIAHAGFDGCSVASNHVLDRGTAGIDATLGHLDRVGVGHAGAARSAEEAHTIRTYQVRGHSIAHLSFTYGFNGFRPPAGEPWRSNLIDLDRILADAARARSEGAAIVVVSLHWGEEYQRAPNHQQRSLAPALGASPDIDLVIGHHAHVVQPLELVEGTWIAYGLGNLLSNMGQPERRDGVLLHVTFEAQPGERFVVSGVSYLPTQVERPGHYIVVAPPDSWARTVEAITSRGAEVQPVQPDLAGEEAA